MNGVADLDAAASNKDWTGDTDNIQINSASSSISPLNGAQLLPLGKDAAGNAITADLQTCGSGCYNTQPIDLSGLYNAPGICVKTSEGRFAAMTLLRLLPLHLRRDQLRNTGRLGDIYLRSSPLEKAVNGAGNHSISAANTPDNLFQTGR